MSDKPPERSKEHLANERTFLAWIRTALGIMAFGFVVEKFSFFLKEAVLLFGEKGQLHIPHEKSSSFFGVFLVATGGLIALLALFNYQTHRKQIDSEAFQPTVVLSTFTTLLVVATSVFLVIYLVTS